MMVKILILLTLICLTILIVDYIPENVKKVDNNSYLVTTKNLTYSFYNVSTGEITEKDSGIPIYENINS